MKPETAKLLDKAAHAMFYIAKALLCEKGLRGYAKHTAIHQAYGEYFAKTGALDAKFHHWLIEAFNRNSEALLRVPG